MGEEGILFKKINTGVLNGYDLAPRTDFHDGKQQILLAHSSFEHMQEGNKAFISATVEKLFDKEDMLTLSQMIRRWRSLSFECGEPPTRLSYGAILALAGDYYARFDDDDDGYTGARKGEVLTQPLMSAPDVKESRASATRHTTHEQEEAANDAFKDEIECALVPHLESWALKVASGCGATDASRAESAAASMRALNRMPTHEKRYYLLTLENWDHFHSFCFDRYAGLHIRAVRNAIQVGERWYGNRTRPGPLTADEITEALQELSHALAMNAFADHFLMDSFSAGHFYGQRKSVMSDDARRGEVIMGNSPDPNVVDPNITLRVELGDESHEIPLGDIGASSFAGQEHDTFSRFGRMAVCNTCPDESLRGKKFRAFGDWQAARHGSTKNSALVRTGRYDIYMMRMALGASVAEILSAFLLCRHPADVSIVEFAALKWAIHDVENRCGCRDRGELAAPVSVPRRNVAPTSGPTAVA